MLTLNGEPFSQGSQPYYYGKIDNNASDKRVMLEVVIGGFRTHAMLDTGAAFITCSPSVASKLNLAGAIPSDPTTLLIRGKDVYGVLYRMDLTVIAEEGAELTIQATTFVPHDNSPWPGLPPIIGLEGCLEQVRFALDTYAETFYFEYSPIAGYVSSSLIVQT